MCVAGYWGNAFQMLKQKTGSDASAVSQKQNAGGVQIKSVSASGNIKIGLKEVKVVSSREGQAEQANSSSKTAPVAKSKAGKLTVDTGSSTPKPEAKTADPKPAASAKMPTASALKSAAQQATPTPKALPKKAEMSSLKRLGFAAAALASVAVVLGLSHFLGGAEEAPVQVAAPAQVSAPVAPAPAPSVTTETANIQIDEAELGLLLGAAAAADLKSETAVVAVPPEEVNAMISKITAGTIAALRSPSKSAAAPAPAPVEAAAQPAGPSADVVTGLIQTVMTALAQGQTEAEINEMLNTGYAKGEIEVPPVLVDATGRVSTATIMALLIVN